MMRSGFYPYRLLLLVAVSLSMLALLKINKLSFYHHYFKIIEEVEIRNSQEVGTQLMTFVVVEDAFRLSLQLIWLFAGSLSVTLFLLFTSFSGRIPYAVPVFFPSARYTRVCPIRAP